MFLKISSGVKGKNCTDFRGLQNVWKYNYYLAINWIKYLGKCDSADTFSSFCCCRFQPGWKCIDVCIVKKNSDTTLRKKNAQTQGSNRLGDKRFYWKREFVQQASYIHSPAPMVVLNQKKKKKVPCWFQPCRTPARSLFLTCAYRTAQKVLFCHSRYWTCPVHGHLCSLTFLPQKRWATWFNKP